MRVAWFVFALGAVAALLAWWWNDPRPAVVPLPNAPGDAVADAIADSRVATTVVPEVVARVDRESEIATMPGDAASAVASIRGVVTGPDGRAIATASVVGETSDAAAYPFLDAAPRQRHVVAKTATAADGSYELRVATDVGYVVRAEAAGFAPAARGDCRSGSCVDLRLDRGAILVGTVRRLADGSPVPGTRIVVARSLGAGSSWWCGEAITDANGGYRIEDLPAGANSVAVEPRVLAAPRDAEVVLHAGHSTMHDVLLTDGITIRGRVFDAATHAPVVGANVREGWRGRRATSGTDGAFELPGCAAIDDLMLSVDADGYAAIEVALPDGGTAAATRSDVEVLLQRGRRATGRVLDDQGRPLANVYAAAVAVDSSARIFRHDWRAGRTGADGTFDLDRLRPDLPHEVLLLHRGFATAVYAFPVDERERQSIDLGDLVMQRPSSVVGRVVDENGRAVADHDVTLHGTNVDRWRGAPRPDADRAIDSYVAERRCRTDADGRFVFTDVAAGDYEIVATCLDSHDVVRERRGVARAEIVGGIELRLFRGLSIAGTVFVADGGAVPTCYCSIDPEDGQGTSGDVEVAADGRFRAAGLAAGNYVVTVYPYPSAADRELGRSFASRAFVHTAAGTVALRCEVPVLLPVRGIVLDSRRAPLANANVVVFDGEERVGSIVSDAAGYFAVPAPFGRTLHVVVTTPSVSMRVDAVAGGPPLEITIAR